MVMPKQRTVGVLARGLLLILRPAAASRGRRSEAKGMLGTGDRGDRLGGVVEGLGVFRLPEEFTRAAGEFAEPPAIPVRRFGTGWVLHPGKPDKGGRL